MNRISNLTLKIICALAVLLIIAGYNGVITINNMNAQIEGLEEQVAGLETAQAATGSSGAAAGSADSAGSGAAAGVYQDGTYTGSAEGYGGTVTMEVVIKDGKIDQINPVSHDGEDKAYWDMAVAVIPQIVESQGAQADAVSGATFSSSGIINAVIAALEQAM